MSIKIIYYRTISNNHKPALLALVIIKTQWNIELYWREISSHHENSININAPCKYVWSLSSIGQLPRVSGKDPERKEWTSVFETFFVCLFFWANFLIFTAGRRAGPRGNWPTPSCIQRGSREDRVDFSFWNVLCLSVCVFFVGKFSHFPLSTFSFYTVQYRRVQ